MSRYVQQIERYWRTYRPTDVAQMPDPAETFLLLSEQVERVVDAASADGRKAAEEEALAEVRPLPEPGRETARELSALPGWDETGA